ncbi:MAG TPA: TRAP transporter large permease subunit [Spirochaetia bacterium]|nr:TRAP transporter large permease subunit [Spirochaetia bacterium]
MSTSPPTPAPRESARRVRAILTRAEDLLSVLLIVLAALLSILPVFTRLLHVPGVRGGPDYIRHLVLWIAFAGGAITTREGRHLALSFGVDLMPSDVKAWVKVLTSFVDILFLTVLTIAGLSFSLLGFDPTAQVGRIPAWILSLIMPAGFTAMGVRTILHSSPSRSRRWIVAAALLPGLAFGLAPLANLLSTAGALGQAVAAAQTAVAPVLAAVHIPLLLLLIASTLVGGPFFILLGGLAVLFFFHAGGALEAIPNEAYVMLSGPLIPAIPLFTLAGFIISESKAGERLVRLFKALLGWLPGGAVIMSVLICAFLTTFTGASGVTILAAGGLLFYILTQDGYRKPFSTGLLTASGSIGLLFPPSLPVILYGVIAQVSIKELYVGGLLPGIFMMLTLAAMGFIEAARHKTPRTPFRLTEALPALRDAGLEVILPFLILFLFLRGIMTLVETAAFSVLYAFVLEVFVHRDIKFREIPGVFLKSTMIMGGVLVILSMANALSYYLVDAQIPTKMAAWLHTSVRSPVIFLLLVNLALLVVGSFLEIYSSITVVAPLLIPLGVSYGVEPLHLGIIFLANMELGYLMPPVGINLFLSSYRFERPLALLYRDVLPFLLVLLAAVLVITYVPWMTSVLRPLIKF